MILRDPAWSRMTCFSSFFRHLFGTPFFPILVPTWLQLGTQNPPKIRPRAIQKHPKIWSFFWSPLGSIFCAISCQFGANLAPKTVPKWCQVGFQERWKQRPAKMLKSLKNLRFFNDFGVFRGSKLEPKSIKNLFKKVFETRYNSEWIWDCSWFDFSSILDLIWGASWGQVGTKLL